MLKATHNTNLPIDYPVDISAEFLPGMIAQLKIVGNDLVVGVSDGTSPIGIFDDTRTTAFYTTQIDEVVEIECQSITTDLAGNKISAIECNGVLEFAGILSSSFTADMDVILIDVNGVVIIPTGTELNADLDGDGELDGFRIIASYQYRIPNKPGEDTTISSGRASIHYGRGWFETDQFDATQSYPLNANLYCGLDGKLTSRKVSDNHPAVAIVTGIPSAVNPTIQFLWL